MPFIVRGYPSKKFLDFLFTECFITYVQNYLSNMAPGGILHGGPNILSLSIEPNWENSDAFHSSQSGWLFNLSLVILPVYGTKGSKPTCYISCEIISGVGSKYLGIY